MSITSTNPIWSALDNYYGGSAQSSLAAPSTTTTANPATAASAGPVSQQVEDDTLTALLGLSPTAPNASSVTSLAAILGVPAAAPSASSGNTLMSDVLGGQSSGAVEAVSATVNQSILDTLL
jgi:hypothetical protein